MFVHESYGNTGGGASLLGFIGIYFKRQRKLDNSGE